MGHFDWDPDELLNFDYGKSVPDRGSAEREVKQAADGYRNNQQRGLSQADEAQLYNALRKESEEQKLREQIDAKMRAQRDAQMRAKQEAREREEREIKQAQLRAYQESERRAQERARAERAAQQEAYEKAQRQAQYEAQMRAQQEAQQRAQHEAQMRAQQEAQQRAQYEAQMRAQQEAQQRAQYEAQMRAQQERARQEAQIRAQQETEQRAHAEQPVIDEAARLAQKEAEAKKQAQIEAYERYRAQSRNGASASKTTRSFSGGSNGSCKKFHKWGKILMIIYGVALAAFAVSLTIMNVLPILYLLLIFAILAALTGVLIYEYRQEIKQKWLRVSIIVLTLILTFVYAMGTTYALGTLSFLSTTTVNNDKKVGRITEESFNVLMTGMDVTGKIDVQGRSDVNMVVTVNPKTATILIVSIPRDYEIRMPDKNYATDKLTHTGFYSVETTIGAVEDLLDIKLNYYVKVNFTTVKAFINTIGGIDVYSEYEFTPEKAPEWTCKKGWNHMDGRQALGFARERHAFEDGDNQRVKNQQAVLEAMIKKATSGPTILMRYSKMITYLADYFEMSISSSEMRALMKYQIGKNPDWKIYKVKLVGHDASKTTYTGGSQPLYVMEQDPESVAHVKKLINAVQSGKELKEDKDGNLSVKEDSGE